jgi:hypothetical protein
MKLAFLGGGNVLRMKAFGIEPQHVLPQHAGL